MSNILTFTQSTCSHKCCFEKPTYCQSNNYEWRYQILF